jgi:hypothetical protein
MGMALGRGNGDHFGVSYSLWSAMLELAQQWGWQPTGTEPPQGLAADGWSGSYYSSDGQRCRDEDAGRLAEAIDRFLSGAPPLGGVTPADEERERLRQFITAAERNFAAPLCHPIGEAGAWLGSDEGRVFLRGFVQFCRKGAFELW